MDAIVKATNVDCVYGKTPKIHRDAAKFDKIPFQESLLRHLRVVCSTVFSSCMDNNTPILMVDAQNGRKNIARALLERMVGRTISNFSTFENFQFISVQMQKSKRQNQ
jgi:uridylate kinase